MLALTVSVAAGAGAPPAYPRDGCRESVEEAHLVVHWEAECRPLQTSSSPCWLAGHRWRRAGSSAPAAGAGEGASTEGIVSEEQDEGFYVSDPRILLHAAAPAAEVIDSNIKQHLFGQSSSSSKFRPWAQANR
jgi:hypothetical protein